MAKVQLANVAVLDNPSPFLNPFQFEVTFECIEELKEGTNFDFTNMIPLGNAIILFYSFGIFECVLIFRLILQLP